MMQREESFKASDGFEDESKNEATSRTWKVPSSYSQKETGDLNPTAVRNFLNPANNPNEQEMDSSLEPPEWKAAC